MSNTGREGITDKISREAKPDSQKSMTEQAGDKLTGAYESVAGSAQPNSEKSTGQRATDAVSGDSNDNSQSLFDKTKETLGMGGNKH